MTMKIELDIDIYTYPDVPLPQVWTVEQRFETPSLSIEEIQRRAGEGVLALVAAKSLPQGASVAVGVGSRGLDNLVPTVQAVIATLKAAGYQPFIIPAMGSHGGATAEGQIEVLEGYGITPESTGAEIRATMEVTQIGTLDGDDAGDYAGQPIFCDKNALQADAILLINRIKPHTDFTGEIESGIAKMSVIGLGKRHGAESVHRYGALGLRNLMPRIARWLSRRLPILGGIALIENELGRTAEVHPLLPEQIGADGEKALLKRARSIMPRLPFPEIDLLVIDEMGKNISGAGMDTHVIGRGFMPSLVEQEWGGPNIRLIAVLDLTPESHGNATALGLADITTRNLVEKADFRATYINLRTSGEGGILRGRLPIILPTGEDCVRTAIATCGRPTYKDVRIVRIRNTASTRVLEVSEALVQEARSNPNLTVSEASHSLDLCQPVHPSFDA